MKNIDLCDLFRMDNWLSASQQSANGIQSNMNVKTLDTLRLEVLSVKAIHEQRALCDIDAFEIHL